MDTIGWIGSFLLAFCGLPQAYKCWRTKRADDISWMFLLMWGFGELLILVYVIPKLDWPLVFNYAANIIFIGIILRYKLINSKQS